jgi:2-keto-4-pentenoate hydratase/2-oxohepta-3-ene-1,7-dioic acid hydratase in catechol pathway
MRLASYLKDGAPVFGLVSGDGLVTLTGRRPGIDTLRDAIAASALEALARDAAGARPDTPLATAAFIPLVPDASKILCVGANYRDHVAEMGNTEKAWPGWFIRVPDSLVGHGVPLEAPSVSQQFDFEGELALVIGKGGRDIPESEALSHVVGYTCFMDGSVRDYQKRCISAGKNFSNSGSCGPFLVTADEIADPVAITVTTILNGDVVQHAGLHLLIHPLEKIVSYLSTIIQLRPGDVIATGSPSGVGQGRTPPLWMKAGDRLVVEVSSVGRLEHLVRAH